MKTFKELTIQSVFIKNGTEFRKVSLRTARVMGSSKWFYFGNDEVVDKVTYLQK